MGSQKRKDAGFWGLIMSTGLFLVGDNNTLWKLNMNLIFHLSFLSLSLLTHLRESLGNKAVYSQPFVSFPGVSCAFVFKCSSFFYPECPKKFHVHVLGSLCHKNLCPSPVMFFSTFFWSFLLDLSHTHIFILESQSHGLRDPGLSLCSGPIGPVDCCCSCL